MAVIRVNKTCNYTVLSNYHFKENDMSLKAKGLLSLMLSLPDNWDYSVEGLVTLSSDGETSVRTGLKELEQFGYLVRTRVYTDGKISGMEYDIYEKPQPQLDQQEDLSVENLVLGNLVQENRPQLNTNKLNTNKLNTKEGKNVESSSPSSKNTSKLFSAKTNSAKLTKKQESWINHKLDMIENYNFSEKVKDQLFNFFTSLAQTNSLLADIAIQMQLNKLAKEVETESNQIKVIKDTISRGWRSLDYMINDINKPNKWGFDTAKNSKNQLYTEEEKQRLREQIANAEEDDIF